jgi:D-alanine-D-alanine ligase
MKKLRVLALMHPDLVPPETLDASSAKEQFAWKTEYDVTSTLRGLGHEVLSLGVQYDLLPIKKAVDEWHPDIGARGGSVKPMRNRIAELIRAYKER